MSETEDLGEAIEISETNRATCRCSVEVTLDAIGGKWKGAILYFLLERERRFGELGRLMPGVTQRMLTLQLRELERDGFVARNVYRQVPPKVEYSLTEFGKTLEPMVRMMAEWGTAHRAELARQRRATAPPEV